MGKLRLFIENMLVYGLGGIISKIIPLLMIPLITRLMPNSTYFGLSDLTQTVISFAQAFALMGMYDAMYRMFFEQEDEGYKQQVCSTALCFTLASSAAVFLMLILLKDWIAEWFFKDPQYAYLVYLCAISVLVGATNSIVSAPTRMQNKRKIFLVANTVAPILSYSISIPLLLNGYYVIALPLAGIISGVTLEASFILMNRKWFSLGRVNPKLLKQLLVIAIPVMPSFLIYWVFNSCDKLMIANLVGVAAEGIYSVGAKLGHMSQLIYTAFSGGWQYFAFSTMKEENQIKTNSHIFEYLGAISFVATAFMCAWSYPLYKILFEGDYVSGYIISPYLFLAPLLQMLFQVAANQFLVIKKTWPSSLILFCGAVVNVVLNLLLIPRLWIEGAAIATLIGYAATNVVCVMVLCRMKLMVITPRLLLSVAVVITYIIIWRLFFQSKPLVGTIAACSITVIYVLLYKKELVTVLNGLLRRNNKF